jgi:hypothetical protein
MSETRVFGFAADKVNELHMTSDDVATLIITEEGETKHVFVDYLVVTQHTGYARMRQIYEETFVKKLELTHQEIRQQCTGAAFDGKFSASKLPKPMIRW